VILRTREWFHDPAKTGAVMVALGALLISFSGVYVKLAHVTPTVAGFYRVLFGGMVLLLIVGLRREKLWNGYATLLLAVACGFALALDLFFWHKSIHYVGPGLATILANFQVFVLALFGILVLRERLSAQSVLAMPLAMVGLFLLAGIRWNHLEQIYKLGVLLGLVAAGCYAVYVLALKKLQSLAGSPSVMANLSIISLVTALLLGLLAWRHNDSFAIPDSQSFLSLVGYGISTQVMGWVLITRGLPVIRSFIAGMLLLLQPSFAFIWDILFFHRPTDGIDLVGAMICLSAIYMATVKK